MREKTTNYEGWPELFWEEWKETADTLHMLLQMVGKTRVALTHIQNHWWNVPLYLTACGLSTSAMATDHGGVLDIEFDFVQHRLMFRTNRGEIRSLELRPVSVATFYSEYLATLDELGINVHLDPKPVELKAPIRFHEDSTHQSYDPGAANRFWQVLSRTDALLKQFSTNFYGKISPVHFFWGSLDLAVTRFSGRKAPDRPGADAIQREAYSHECISAGFWPGNGGFGKSAFYCYAAPVPPLLADAVLSSRGAFDRDMGEFLLDYEEVRRSPNAEQTILDFLSSTYSAAADALNWDRENLDRRDAIGHAATQATSSKT